MRATHLLRNGATLSCIRTAFQLIGGNPVRFAKGCMRMRGEYESGHSISKLIERDRTIRAWKHPTPNLTA